MDNDYYIELRCLANMTRNLQQQKVNNLRTTFYEGNIKARKMAQFFSLNFELTYCDIYFFI